MQAVDNLRSLQQTFSEAGADLVNGGGQAVLPAPLLFKDGKQ